MTEAAAALRNEIARVVFNCATLLSHWGQPCSPNGIRAQIDECNDLLRKIGCHEMADIGSRPRSILDEL